MTAVLSLSAPSCLADDRERLLDRRAIALLLLSLLAHGLLLQLLSQRPAAAPKVTTPTPLAVFWVPMAAPAAPAPAVPASLAKRSEAAQPRPASAKSLVRPTSTPAQKGAAASSPLAATAREPAAGQAAPSKPAPDVPGQPAPSPTTPTAAEPAAPTSLRAESGAPAASPSMTRAEPAARTAAATAITPPQFDAGYADNPAPDYPPLSRRAQEQGKVILNVQVAATGQPSRVEVKTSSGFERLDRAAVNAVTRWRFVPARQGAEPVSAWVLVPILFQLRSAS